MNQFYHLVGDHTIINEI